MFCVAEFTSKDYSALEGVGLSFLSNVGASNYVSVLIVYCSLK